MQHGRRYRDDHAGWGEAAPRKDVVYQETVDAAIAVLERVEKDKCVGDGGGMHHWVDIARLHALAVVLLLGVLQRNEPPVRLESSSTFSISNEDLVSFS